jgi:hypothetical protein
VPGHPQSGLESRLVLIVDDDARNLKLARDVLRAAGFRTLMVGPGSYALGHVTLDLATGRGTVSLSGGAGEFRSFRARARVSPPGGANGAYWAWDGRYSFGRPD